MIGTAMGSLPAIILKPVTAGWAVCLTNGQELARFRGPGARLRALRYVRSLGLVA
jgi:hypothetical protein